MLLDLSPTLRSCCYRSHLSCTTPLRLRRTQPLVSAAYATRKQGSLGDIATWSAMFDILALFALPIRSTADSSLDTVALHSISRYQNWTLSILRQVWQKIGPRCYLCIKVQFRMDPYDVYLGGLFKSHTAFSHLDNRIPYHKNKPAIISALGHMNDPNNITKQ